MGDTCSNPMKKTIEYLETAFEAIKTKPSSSSKLHELRNFKKDVLHQLPHYHEDTSREYDKDDWLKILNLKESVETMVGEEKDKVHGWSEARPAQKKAKNLFKHWGL